MPTKKTDPLLLVKRITDLESQLQAAQAERDEWERKAKEWGVNLTYERGLWKALAAGMDLNEIPDDADGRLAVMVARVEELADEALAAQQERDALREALEYAERLTARGGDPLSVLRTALRASTPSEDG